MCFVCFERRCGDQWRAYADRVTWTDTPSAPADAAPAAPPVDEIAVIDLAPFLTGGDPAPVVRRIAEVYPLVSFLQVVGHGIAPETFDRPSPTRTRPPSLR
ncbi:2-oxoglutarate and iron-dependent oxygenase domain-containing protein [Pseudofrankia sp. DC12]|uniref:2-oxoglutarate and iron-dependent oxygenase domain-containing protein n=1 Tax=Pseudofrankia sp. DC12 TaxID=683315 RepID=UPI001E4DFAAC|nr:2-oxoglutarate and iron-dependent oxygenase domain-containing protein [Pseudofrankia sp. DC12]